MLGLASQAGMWRLWLLKARQYCSIETTCKFLKTTSLTSLTGILIIHHPGYIPGTWAGYDGAPYCETPKKRDPGKHHYHMVVSLNMGTPVKTPKYHRHYYGDPEKKCPKFREALNPKLKHPMYPSITPFKAVLQLGKHPQCFW